MDITVSSFRKSRMPPASHFPKVGCAVLMMPSRARLLSRWRRPRCKSISTVSKKWADTLADLRVKPSQTLGDAVETTRALANERNIVMEAARSIAEATISAPEQARHPRLRCGK